MWRSLQTRLYSFALPLMLLSWPLMGFETSQIGDYVRGTEFRTFLGEVIIQMLSGFANALFTAFAALFLGLFGGGA